MNSLRNSLLMCLLAALTACVSAGKMWPDQTGVVLDEQTQQPIEGAIVVARWIGTISQIVDSQTTCYHVETATTDAQGRYSLPDWTKMPGKVRHDSIEYTAYKAGYRQVPIDKGTGTQYLKLDTGGVKDRLEYLKWLSGYSGCGAADGSQRNLYSLRESIYYEAKALYPQYEKLHWLRKMAARAWLALDPATSQQEADVAEDRFLQENLR